MGNVISLDKKIRITDKKKEAIERKRKIMAVRKVFQCAHCAVKCEKCGTQIHLDKSADKNDLRVPYNLCISCAVEYRDYIETLKGNAKSSDYWHNDAWLRVWSTWIAYKGATDSYMRSKEFERLLNELKTDLPGSE